MLVCQSLSVDTFGKDYLSVVCVEMCVYIPEYVDVCVCIGVICMFWSLCMHVTLSPGVHVGVYLDHVCQGLCVHRCLESWYAWAPVCWIVCVLVHVHNVCVQTPQC